MQSRDGVIQSSWQKSPHLLQGTSGLKEHAQERAGPPTDAGRPRPPQAGDSLFDGGAELDLLTPPTCYSRLLNIYL